MSINNGKIGAWLQPPKYGTTETGSFTEYEWRGSLATIRAYTNFVAAAGGFWEIEETPTGTNCKLRARFPRNINNTEVPVNTWELISTDAEKDLLLSDIAAVTALTDAERRVIREAIANPDPAVDPTDPSADIVLSSTAIIVYRLMLNGERSNPVSVPTLRHTQTTSNVWTVKWSQTNVNRVLTNKTMGTAVAAGGEGAPTNLVFNLPDVDPAPQGPTFPTLKYGWKKKFPIVRYAYGQRIQIEQEYTYGLWCPTLVGAFIDV